jgi:hypothetical protein
MLYILAIVSLFVFVFRFLLLFLFLCFFEGSDYTVVRGKLAKSGAKRVGARRFEAQDVFVPWHPKEGGPPLARFYHVFVEGELRDLVLATGEADVTSTLYHADNWVVTGVRTSLL